MAEPIRITMWSGPRNISTAMMRSFENRPDTVVEDEPFYAHYLVKTGVDHPCRIETIESQENDWGKVSQRLVSEIPNGKTVWYQKHMGQHNLSGCDLEWTKKMVNCFLIRDPKEVIVSFSKKFKLTSSTQLGFTQQLDLFEKLKNETGKIPLVIDAKDILKNPRAILSKMCENIGIPFMDEMLAWPSGPRKTDGVWAKHWYQNVEASTGFNPYTKIENEPIDQYDEILNECMDAYNSLKQYSIKH
ncbi:MAG: HAD family hydrolase [Candidatus Marinimicrobia bacterium]|nr:HAD family hydrolase [Candidatus Neomarinimicrobiota bacterium]